MPADIEELIQRIRSLSPDDQKRLRQALDAETAPAALAAERRAEEEFKQRLLKAGLLKEIKPPVTNLTPYRDRKPFEIEGKPLSETIIEERR